MLKITLFLFAVTIGCHSSMDDMSSMRSHTEDMTTETARHLIAARGATTMQQMRDEVDVHRSGMASMMAEMAMTMDSMTKHCDRAGAGEMDAMHGEADGEMSQHFSSLDASSDLAAAQAEVERHAASMFAMMDRMDGAMSNMQCH